MSMTTGEQSTGQRQRSIRLRPILLPAEHGSWGFLVEPLLFGLIVALGWASLWLSVAAVAAFFARQPLKVLWQEQQRSRRTARGRIAATALGLEVVVAAVGLLLAINAGGWLLVWPLLLAAPLGIVFLYFDVLGPVRSWQAEVAAPAALGSVTAAMALAGGWSWPFALAFWCVLVARAVPAVLLVRTRLKHNKGRPAAVAVPLVAQLAGLVAVLLLVAAGLLPGIAIVLFALLLLRALLLLTRWGARVPVKVIGFGELGLGLLTVVLIAMGAVAMA